MGGGSSKTRSKDSVDSSEDATTNSMYWRPVFVIFIAGVGAEALPARAPLAAAFLAAASLSAAASWAAASAARLYLLSQITIDNVVSEREPRLHYRQFGASGLHFDP